MQTNSVMRRLAVDWRPRDAGLAPGLAALLGRGIEELHGCAVLGTAAAQAEASSVAEHGDATGFEAVYNHVHIDEHLSSGFSTAELHEQTAAFTQQLIRLLQQTQSQRSFAVIVSIADYQAREELNRDWGITHGEDEPFDFFPGASVRFHVLRTDQPWLAANLEQYRYEAVMSAVVEATARA